MSLRKEAVDGRTHHGQKSEVRFRGGLLQRRWPAGQDFRLDIEGEDISEEELARYVVEDMRLLMVEEVRILNKEIIAEHHKRVDPSYRRLAVLPWWQAPDRAEAYRGEVRRIRIPRTSVNRGTKQG